MPMALMLVLLVIFSLMLFFRMLLHQLVVGVLHHKVHGI